MEGNIICFIVNLLSVSLLHLLVHVISIVVILFSLPGKNVPVSQNEHGEQIPAICIPIPNSAKKTELQDRKHAYGEVRAKQFLLRK